MEVLATTKGAVGALEAQIKEFAMLYRPPYWCAMSTLVGFGPACRVLKIRTRGFILPLSSITTTTCPDPHDPKVVRDLQYGAPPPAHERGAGVHNPGLDDGLYHDHYFADARSRTGN